MKFIWEITEQRRIVAKLKKALETDNFDRAYITDLILKCPQTRKDFKILIKFLKKIKKETEAKVVVDKRTLH